MALSTWGWACGCAAGQDGRHALQDWAAAGLGERRTSLLGEHGPNAALSRQRRWVPSAVCTALSAICHIVSPELVGVFMPQVRQGRGRAGQGSRRAWPCGPRREQKPSPLRSSLWLAALRSLLPACRSRFFSRVCATIAAPQSLCVYGERAPEVGPPPRSPLRPQVTALLRHDRDLVKKKALLALHRFIQASCLVQAEPP